MTNTLLSSAYFVMILLRTLEKSSEICLSNHSLLMIMCRICDFSYLESQRPSSDKGKGYNDAIGREEICPLSAVLLT